MNRLSLPLRKLVLLKLTEKQIDYYKSHGFLVVGKVLLESDLQPVIDEICGFIDRRSRELKSQGELVNLYENEPFERRFAYIYSQYPAINEEMDIMNLRGKAMFDFLRNENLLDIVESLIGGEILCNPIQHLRAKPPVKYLKKTAQSFYGVPWHQDAAVTLEEADNSEIITFWIPLVNATIDSGCMDVMPEGYKMDLLRHESSPYGTAIENSLLPDIKPHPVPCPKGGLVIMNKYTPHRSGDNQSDIVRWSIDLRYQKIGTPTGRPFHPAFIVRSRSNPENVMTDHNQWSKSWAQALENSKGRKIHRID